MSVARFLTLSITYVAAIVGAPDITKIGEISDQLLHKYVRVAGTISERNQGERNLFLKLSDGTGTITVLIIASRRISTERLQKGTYITAHGEVDFDKGRSHQGELLVKPRSNADITYPPGPPKPSILRYVLLGLLSLAMMAILILLGSWFRSMFGELLIGQAQLKTTVTELQRSIVSPIEVAALVSAEMKRFEPQDAPLADVLNERITALIPQEGIKPPEFFWKKDIRTEFYDGIGKAKSRIDIESPWVTSGVLEHLLPSLEAALKRGVEVRIVYGYPDNKNPALNKKQNDTKTQAARLRERFQCYDVLFKMRYGPTHGKAFICDDDFLLVGSYNFLSFEGVFKADTHSEMVVKIRDKKSIEILRITTFDF